MLDKKHTSQHDAAGDKKLTITQNGERKVTPSPLPAKAYRKNGILVHNAGKVISSETVTKAFAEE